MLTLAAVGAQLQHCSCAGFIQLAAQYNISKPDTFLDRLIDIETSTLAPGQGDNPTYTKANYANILLRAFVGSHVLPRPAEAEPQDIYSNQTVSHCFTCCACCWPLLCTRPMSAPAIPLTCQNAVTPCLHTTYAASFLLL